MSGTIKLMDRNTVPSPSAYQRYRTCDRKKVYPSMEAGWRAVKYIQHNGNDRFPDFELRPYLCAFCGRIHVGHSNIPRITEQRLKAESQPKEGAQA